MVFGLKNWFKPFGLQVGKSNVKSNVATECSRIKANGAVALETLPPLFVEENSPIDPIVAVASSPYNSDGYCGAREPFACQKGPSNFWTNRVQLRI